MELNRRITIDRISVGSAFRVGLALYAVLFALFGLLGLLFYGLIASLAIGSSLGSQESNEILGLLGGGIIGAVIFYIMGIIFYGVMGGIAMAISALFYNLIAGIVGGIEMDIS